MTRAELYVSELRKLETPENKAVVEGIIKGFSEILIESYRDIGMDIDSYDSLEEYRRKSRMSTKAFVESVGNTIIGSDYPDEKKAKLLDNLERYAKVL